ncbi:MAG: hypothetical protein H7Y17_14920 [Chlorobia bacterium]|nr:hypothetical protein [Fimbriimonadaceae bacterium]
MILTSVILGLTLMTSAPQVQPSKPTFFIFLVKGKNPPQATQEEIGKYQMAHIENFKRLFNEGKLATAGPLADPTEYKRGIIILTVASKSDIPPLFEPDPYVAKGFMEIQALPLSIEFGKINTEAIDPNGIEENRIVVFTAGAVNSDSASARSARLRHLDHIRKDGIKSGLAFYASLQDSPDIRAVALFRGKKDKEILDWIKKDPLVKNGTLKATKMPQWLSKGAL